MTRNEEEWAKREEKLTYALAVAEVEIRRLRERLRITNVAQLVEPLYQLFNRLCRRELPRISRSDAAKIRHGWMSDRDRALRVQQMQQDRSLNIRVVKQLDAEKPEEPPFEDKTTESRT